MKRYISMKEEYDFKYKMDDARSSSKLTAI